MKLNVREMALDDVPLRIEYFHTASDELLELMGVDRARIPSRGEWMAFYQEDYARQLEERRNYSLVWEVDGAPIGFSSTDKIKFGEEAFMHLHITVPARRGFGLGTEFVRRSADIYFERLELVRLFSEPHAFNPAPNRTLQKAGFRYVSTQQTTPGLLNTFQTTNRWVMERTAPPQR